VSNDRDTIPPPPPPVSLPPYPQFRPDWVGDLVQQFVNASVKALDARLAPVLDELKELREADQDREEELRRLRRRIRKIEKAISLAPPPGKAA